MQTFAVSSLLAFFYGAIGATSTASWLANGFAYKRRLRIDFLLTRCILLREGDGAW
jgi:hypothetical protein